VLSAIHADHYPVEHWLLERSRIPADECPPLTLSVSRFCGEHGSRSPSFTDRSLRERPELSLFRFEGAALRVDPGDVPLVLVRARGRVSARVESSPSGAPRAWASFLLSCRIFVCRGDHAPRACHGRVLSRCAAVLVQRGSRPRRALCSPLRIPKRARASLFSKLQRANGECLGA
jgi:hypothetical protein